MTAPGGKTEGKLTEDQRLSYRAVLGLVCLAVKEGFTDLGQLRTRFNEINEIAQRQAEPCSRKQFESFTTKLPDTERLEDLFQQLHLCLSS